MTSRKPSPHEFLLIDSTDPVEFTRLANEAAAEGFAPLSDRYFRTSTLPGPSGGVFTVYSLLMVRDREPR